MTTIDHIMQLSGEMPNAPAHRHYLEQLPVSHLEQRLEDLRTSEKKHAGRWYGGQDITRHTLREPRELTNA
jgi:hypothetical protein